MSCFVVSLFSLLFVGFALLLIKIEGVVCLVMAMPLALPLVLFGSALGVFFQPSRRRNDRVRMIVYPLAIIPLFGLVEKHLIAEPETIRVTTTIEIDAPLEVVWRNVVTFSELPPPDEFLFKTGIAYPIRAEIHGSGVGAIRHCVFSTGPFVEPITEWNKPRTLAFNVSKYPEPMRELSPFGHIHPPHLDGYLVSEKGRFDLEPLPGERTRLHGTTWYRHRFLPAAYWTLWSDGIIHTIHRRVLKHIKTLSESAPITPKKPMSDKTLFQKIADREIPATFVHEDELCVAIRDIAPRAPTHILVIPRKPIPRIADAGAEDAALLGHLLLTARDIAAKLGVRSGFRLVINNGRDGGETVPHLHIHLLGGRALDWPPG